MPDLDWKAFRSLPGASWRNWELLCHGLIRRNYGAYGNLVAVRVQPVVEFHLTLTEDCPGLGKRGEQWGWQCKFWDEDKPKLNSSRKQVLTKAFKNQPTHLPELDRLVIWTHRKLRKGDWEWIQENAPKGLNVDTWWEDHVSDLLAGDAAPLQETYFGSAVLVPDQLSTAHEETKATLRGLLPEIHITVQEERTLQKLRGRAQDWTELTERAERLATQITSLRELGPSVPENARAEVTAKLIGEAEQAAEVAHGVVDFLEAGLTFKATELAEQAPAPRDEAASESVRELERELENKKDIARRDAVAGLSASLAATASTLQRLAWELQIPVVAVQGPVGSGKTQLAARLSAPAGTDPAGAIVPAKGFRSADIDVNRLAACAGLPALPIDGLLEALDAAGGRSGQRLPLVIDGLHESLDAAAWHDALARLASKVKRLSNVYVLVTLRPSYAQDCLPEATNGLSLQGFRMKWREACEQYFDLYKIRADLDLLPAERFADPLFVRVFCEATNPHPEAWVDLGTVPPSLVGALEGYLGQAIGRIRDRLRLDPAALRECIRHLAMAYWSQDTRALPLKEAKRVVGDNELALDDSVAYALETEGLLDRDRAPEGGETLSPMFDALGGYLIADALLPSGQARDNALAAIVGRLEGPGAHPLGEDIRQALGHLFAARARTTLHEASTDEALRRTATLDLLTADSQMVTTDDTAAITRLVVRGEALGQQWWIAIRNRAIPGHPFNSLWLDRTLRPLGVAQRDLDWTELLRRNADDLTLEIERLTARWREGLRDNDELHLRWLAWVLTSTDRALRDRATEALYWFGRHDPQSLHGLTLELLDVNDPYVPERLMAASYGVAMANQIATPAWRAAMPALLDGLDEGLFEPRGGGGPAHWLLREYALGIRQLVCDLHPDLAGGRKAKTHTDVPLPSGPIGELGEADVRYDDVLGTLGSDFHNYTLGRLVEDRANYDFQHRGHQQVVAEVLARVWDLGWRPSDFSDLDSDLAQASFRRHDLDPDRADRYGKKYAWIGYYEAAGRRAHTQTLTREHLADVDIDPSFPLPVPSAPISLPSWVKSRHTTDESWVKTGRVLVPDELLVARTLDGSAGPWVCLDGFLRIEDETQRRKVFTFIWGAMVPVGQWSAFAASLSGSAVGRRTMPEPAEDYYTFAGEIPWAPIFAEGLRIDGHPNAPVQHRDLGDGDEIDLVGTAHEYAWEGYHSITNQDVGGTVPSRAICEYLGLRGLPQTLDMAEADGTVATRSLAAPAGYDGRLLYMRADLLERYTRETETEMGWVIWGERLLVVDRRDTPEWYRQLRRGSEDQHLRIASLSELI